MSNSEVKNITCPNCGKESKFEIWSSVNTDINPELKEKLIDKTLFEFICPDCKEKTIVNYDVLYHDMKSQQMIYYVTDEQSFNKAINMFNYEQQRDVTSKVLEKYQKRVVVSPNQLAEKIIINELGLDDKVIELIKLIYYIDLCQKKDDAEVDAICFHYDKKENKSFIQFVFEEKVIAAASFDKETYDNVEKRFSEKLKAFSGDVVIDFDWVMNRFADDFMGEFTVEY